MVTDKDRKTAQALANRGPDILRGIYRDELEAIFTAHREEACAELVEALERISELWHGELNQRGFVVGTYDPSGIARTALANHKGDE